MCAIGCVQITRVEYIDESSPTGARGSRKLGSLLMDAIEGAGGVMMGK